MARILTVLVRPGAREEKVEEVGKDSYKVSVRAPAREGEANTATLELLARYLNLPPHKLKLLRGKRSRRKTIAVE